MNQLRREGEIRIHVTHIGLWEDLAPSDTWRFTQMFPVLCKIVNTLRRGGWKVRRDTAHMGENSSIGRYYWCGKKGDLEFFARAAGRHFEIEFFQNIKSENPNGGRYDFQKLRGMGRVSRALRLQCLAEMLRLVRLCEGLGYVLTERDGFGGKAIGPSTPRLVRDIAELGDNRGTPLESFNRGWGSDRFDRDETGWPSRKEVSSWRYHDRDGKPITQGVTKYMRDRDGRLVRGQVFGGINGNWDLVSNGTTIAWSRHAREFFDCEHPEREPQRVFDRKKRLREELDKALKAENFARVAVLGAKLAQEAA